MPLTNKGEEIMNAMQEEYGPEKGEGVFYASKNKGTITGVDATDGAGEQLIGLSGGGVFGNRPAYAPKHGGFRRGGISGMDAISNDCSSGGKPKK